ncbi:uncharacterized protein LOC113951388 [Corapipo altera]|uniref:uncharacterized protein LOC113951388 n=1 Tax=Corapipo altera TaxID=415028 RepID=UPI000FD65B70|nr:uncharacterized protein LOC113951388 [Corapipo altera]
MRGGASARWALPDGRTRWPLPGARFAVPGALCPMCGAQCPLPCVRFPEAGARCPVPGACCPVPWALFPVAAAPLGAAGSGAEAAPGRASPFPPPVPLRDGRGKSPGAAAAGREPGQPGRLHRPFCCRSADTGRVPSLEPVQAIVWSFSPDWFPVAEHSMQDSFLQVICIPPAWKGHIRPGRGQGESMDCLLSFFVFGIPSKRQRHSVEQ